MIGLDIEDVRRSVRSLMWRHVAIERDGEHLEEVSKLLKDWARYSLGRAFHSVEAWELQNMLTVASLVTASAIWRKESRGTHHRTDFPDAVDAFRGHDVWRRGEGEPTVRGWCAH